MMLQFLPLFSGSMTATGLPTIGASPTPILDLRGTPKKLFPTLTAEKDAVTSLPPKANIQKDPMAATNSSSVGLSQDKKSKNPIMELKRVLSQNINVMDVMETSDAEQKPHEEGMGDVTGELCEQAEEPPKGSGNQHELDVVKEEGKSPLFEARPNVAPRTEKALRYAKINALLYPLYY